ncbi:hypothetical protein ACLMJK_009164 [Lecanora helva]
MEPVERPPGDHEERSVTGRFDISLSARSSPVPQRTSSTERAHAEYEQEVAAFANIRAELKKATGFDCYRAFCESLDRHPLFSPTFKDLGLDANQQLSLSNLTWWGGNSRVSIFNLIKNETGSIEIHTESPEPKPSEISAALCNSPDKLCARILVWSERRKAFGPRTQSITEVLGLGLRLDPKTFDSDLRYFDSSSASTLRFESIDATVSTARNYALAESDHVPFLMIVAEPGLRAFSDLFSPSLARVMDDSVDFTGTYRSLLVEFLRKRPISDDTSNELIVLGLLPLVRLDIARMQQALALVMFHCDDRDLFSMWEYPHVHLKSQKEEEAPEYLYTLRSSLRAHSEHFSRNTERIRSFANSQSRSPVLQSPVCNRMIEERHFLAQTAKELDAEIRDYLQTQASRLAILESRKSIELSNTQILEAKRGSFPASISSD